MLFLFLYFSCKDNLNFPICQTNSCFFTFPHKNRVGGQAPPHAKPAPLSSSFTRRPSGHVPKRRPRVWLQSAAPRVWRQSTVACDFTLGPDPSKHSTLLWGLTPASSLRLIRRPVTTVVVRRSFARVGSRWSGRTLTVVIGVVGLFHSSRISRGDTLHDLTVTVVAGDLDGGRDDFTSLTSSTAFADSPKRMLPRPGKATL